MIMRRASSCALLLILCWMAVVQGLARTSKRMQKRCILMSSRGSGSTPTTSSTSNKFRALKPIPGCGGYFIADADDTNARISSVFLAPTKMEVEQLDNEDDMILLNVLPVPVRSDVELALRAAGSINSAQQMVAKEIITSRDGGVCQLPLLTTHLRLSSSTQSHRTLPPSPIAHNTHSFLTILQRLVCSRVPNFQVCKSVGLDYCMNIETKPLHSCHFISAFDFVHILFSTSGARDTAVTNFSPTKKMVFDYVQGRSYEKEKAKGPKSFHSPYHAMIEALDTIGHLQVMHLLFRLLHVLN